MTLTLTQTVPLTSQECELSVGHIIGIVISILVVVIGAIIGFFLLRRGRRCGEIESQSNSPPNSSIPRIDFNDEQIEGGDDTILTASTDQATDEEDLQMVVSIPTGFAVSIPSPLILWSVCFDTSRIFNPKCFMSFTQSHCRNV
jgi:hypothetical protein